MLEDFGKKNSIPKKKEKEKKRSLGDGVCKIYLAKIGISKMK